MTEESKKMLWKYYTRDRYPVLLGMSGPWEIRGQLESDHCAAIPTDRGSGHLPSGYGDRIHVARMLRAGHVLPP